MTGSDAETKTPEFISEELNDKMCDLVDEIGGNFYYVGTLLSKLALKIFRAEKGKKDKFKIQTEVVIDQKRYRCDLTFRPKNWKDGNLTLHITKGMIPK